MNKLLSCCYNMDTDRVEARFEDGTTVAIDCTAIEARTSTAILRRSGQNWTGCCTTNLWNTHSLC